MASRKNPPPPAKLEDDDFAAVRDILAHLNFSGGRRDPKFLANINRLWPKLDRAAPAAALQELLLSEADKLQGSSPVFQDLQQARQVTQLVLTDFLAAYRQHHADLLFHLPAIEYEQPLLIGAFFEVVLAQGAPWDDRDRIIPEALKQANDFVGYRPIPVLENGMKMEIYDHERFRPVPIYMEGVGVAHGPFADLISATVEFLKQAPKDLLLEAHFDFELMEELAIDVRAHDHLHPVNKRTNYMFGEWDPHRIDVKGRYRRVVLRRIILDALLAWVDDPKSRTPRAERLFDAAAALCGTMLMASSISGSGPGVHDSSVTLTSLLPIVARRRDAFYQRLMQNVDGNRAKRLKREEQRTQQPFGHIRQFLNMHLAGYGARQIQFREIAYLYAKMGYPDAARAQADAIPAASIRFECEIQCRIGLAHHALNQNQLSDAVELVTGLYSMFQRGIQCGALVDPWNILGFQGQFPLFSSREDTIPDNRIEALIELVEDTLEALSRVLSEAAAQGNGAARERILAEFHKVAEWWDKFASTTVDDIPKVSGQDSLDAATHVSEALTEWRRAGEAAGDVGFWRQHVDQFDTAQAYALVVDALLYRKDSVASLALLMQWLSQCYDERVGFESPKHSLFAMLIRWMKVTVSDQPEMSISDRANLLRRMFAFLEANADELWSVPRMEGAVERAQKAMRDDPLKDEAQADEEGDEDDVFGAAYEDVTYKDTADDGNWGNTLENDFGFRNTEFEVINRDMEPRLKFINAAGQLWQMAGVRLAADLHAHRDQPLTPAIEQTIQAVRDWRTQAQRWQVDLAELMEGIWDHEIAGSSGDHDANVEYDIQLQVKFYMLHQVISTLICLRNADRLLSGCLPVDEYKGTRAEDDPELAALIRAVVRRDVETVKNSLSTVLEWMSKHALLYVPLDNGGKPAPILRAQMMQSVIRFLLRELPRMGLLFETFRVLQTAFQMERKWRPDGQAITEFDRLFDLALRHVLEEVITSARTWGDPNPTETLIDAIGEIVEPFQDLWLDHSRTMRISSVDGLRDNDDWLDLADFIREYGGDLLHASQLTLGNVRAILHQGIDWYLDYLEEQQDPLKPMKLLEDLDTGMIDREHAEWCLETIYTIVVDKFDRFLEYNTTTTQSDYGNMFYCLLDFLRLEARYDRDSWSMSPITLVHEMLTRLRESEAARLWEGTYEAQTTDLAARHLQDLSGLQRAYGMRMPTIADHLNQRFVKPLAVNRMLAFVQQAVEDSRAAKPSESFDQLRKEVDEYLTDSWGSGVDIPPWLRQLEKEVYDVVEPDEGGRPAADAELAMGAMPLTKDDFQQQLKSWPRRGRVRPPGKPAKGKRRGRKKPPEESSGE